MKIRFKFKKNLVYLIVFLFSISGILFIINNAYLPEPPKDKDLIKIFYSKRAAFERLRQMSSESTRSKWYLRISPLNNHERQARLSEFMKLTLSIDQDLEVSLCDQPEIPWCDQIIRFYLAGGGIYSILPRWSKGVEYLPVDPKKEGVIVTSLDNPSLFLDDGIYLKRIEKNWFIFFQKF